MMLDCMVSRKRFYNFVKNFSLNSFAEMKFTNWDISILARRSSLVIK